MLGFTEGRGVARAIFSVVLFLLVLWCCGRSPSSVEDKEKKGAKSPNRPPIVLRAEIQPRNPSVRDILGVAVESTDPDGDEVQNQFQWIVNGEPLEGGTEPLLEGSILKKGDTVQCLVVPTDGESEGAPFMTDTVKIANSLPVVRRVDLVWSGALPGAKLELASEAEDADGDGLTWISQWFVNGEIVNTNASSISTAGLKKGDRVAARVCVSDGEPSQVCLWSKEIVLPNRAPEIISRPQTRWTPQEGFVYQIQVRDPDGDEVRVKIKGDLPDGAVWDPSAMVLRWTPRPGLENRGTIVFVAEDSDGGWTIQELALEARGEFQ